MTKNAMLKKIAKLGWAYAIIDNCDTGPKQVRLSCEFQGNQGEEEMCPGNYYGTNNAPWPTIEPALEALAAEADSYWEWENPAVISLYL